MTLFFSASIGAACQVESTLPDPGKVSVRIYTNFNYGLDPANQSTAFELTRAYFGYDRKLSNHFFGEVKLDIGSINDQSEYSLIHRYTYFKNAYLSYNNGKVLTWFGLFDMLQFKLQERFWGYRYLYKSYMDQYRFGSSADLGAGFQYSPSEKITCDLIISNGEGYTDLQFDNVYRVGTGLTLVPVKGLTIRAYYVIHTADVSQMIFSGFIGYRMERLRIGAEYNHQFDYQFNEDHNRFGYSVYSTYAFNSKWEVFARYDQLYSNILPGEETPWNLGNDGSAIISGIQYTPIGFVHLALNYQDWVEYAQNGNSEPYLYLNIEIVF
jgi:hypothetical protein